MSTTPAELLDLAKAIAADPGEAHQRSAVSRAYYAAYHGCKAWYEQLPGIASIGGGPEGGVHQNLINQLQNPAPELTCAATRKASRLLGTRLQVYKTQRVKADYFLSEPNPYAEWSANAIAGVGVMLAQMQSTHQALPSMAPAQEAPLPVSAEVQATPAIAAVSRPALKRVK